MQGKEVGSIIGKKGDNIKKFREVSGAKINVSDSSCPDRIVTLVGAFEEVCNALSMICAKLEEQVGPSSNFQSGTNSTNPLMNPLSNTSAGSNQLLGNPGSTVTEPLFGLPPSGILNKALNEGPLGVKDADMLTMNNNSTSTINNNNLGALNKNLTAEATNNSSSAFQPPLTLRLIVPASLCGSLIGRGGAKIKEVREKTGATIQVAPDVLPHSTERVVTISGNLESLRTCINQICLIMVESPPKGYTIPYRPKPALNPILLAAAATAGQAAAYNLPGQYALSTHPDVNRLFVANNPLAAAAAAAFNPTAAASLRAATGQTAAALSAVASQSIGSHEMTIPNGLIGCVIGKGGSKINEIRQLSGATIKISDSEEGSKNRTVTINGTPEAISLAQYLITANCNGNQASLLESITKPWAANKSARKFAPY